MSTAHARSVPGVVQRVMPASLDDWPAMVRRTSVRPALDGRSPTDPSVQAAFRGFVLQLGPINLPHVRDVAAAIDDAHVENDLSLVGPQRCVVIDGRPHAGKTYAALTKAFAETRAVWDSSPPEEAAAARSIPWVYVEIPPRAQALSLYQAILTFCGMPIPSGRTNATALGVVLRSLAPQVGMRGVIIDDSHGIAGTEPRVISDILKTVITGIPATIVMIGASLRERGVFDTLAGEQVVERANWVHVPDWPVPPSTGDVGPWAQLAAYFTHARPLPDPEREVRLDSRQTLTYLATGSRQKPGVAIHWLKAAACHAINHHTDLDLTSLRATEPKR